VEVRDGAPDAHPQVSAAIAATLATATGASGFPRLAPSGASVLLTNVPLR
jgi:hypothetical protein